MILFGVTPDRIALAGQYGVAFASLFAAITLLCLPAIEMKKGRACAVLALSIALFVALCLSCFRFTVDDAFIGLRFARNLADGYGLVYSTDGSDRVEGYTNFLWTVSEAPWFLLHLPTASILKIVKIVGIVFGVGVIVGIYRLIRQISGSPRAAAAGALFVAAVPYLAFWSIGGLETPMFLFWLVAGLCAYEREERLGRGHVGSFVLFTLMALTRPEGLLFVFGFLFYETAASLAGGSAVVGKVKRLLPGALVFLVIYGSYFAWRYRFYGYFLPNTFYAKAGGRSSEQLLGRLLQVAPFFTYLLPFAALGWIGSCWWAGDRRWRGRMVAVLAMLFVFCFASKREWMPGFRYELALVPVLACLAAIGLDQLMQRISSAQDFRWYVPWGALACLGIYAICPMLELRLEAASSYRTVSNVHQRVGEWLKHYAPPNATFAGWDLGAIPYFSEIPKIIEVHPEGILNPQTAHFGLNLRKIMDDRPTFVVLPPVDMAPEIYDKLKTQTSFEQDYRRIASLKKYYPMEIYALHSAEISPAAIAALQEEP
jgi:hypothetical protein